MWRDIEHTKERDITSLTPQSILTCRAAVAGAAALACPLVVEALLATLTVPAFGVTLALHTAQPLSIQDAVQRLPIAHTTTCG